MIDAKERVRNQIPLSVVAKFYRNGVTRERIRQIECGNVSRQIERAYKAALRAAIVATFGKAARSYPRRSHIPRGEDFRNRKMLAPKTSD